MKLRKGVRILLWSTGILVAGVALLYLLRWPLFGGTVRAKVSELLAREIQSDVEFGDLGGSLVAGVDARKVRLKPRPGSPLKSAEVDRIEVRYGLFLSGEPRIEIDGARIVLALKEGPTPPVHETIRDVVALLRSLRFPGAAAATNVELVLPDGRALKLDRAALDHAAWNVSLRGEGFGTVTGSATLSPDGALTFDGQATEGPVRSAKIELGAGAERAPLKITTELGDVPLLARHPLRWEGSATFEQKRIVRVEGELTVKEGRAQTRVDLRTGRVEADVDAVIAVDQKDFRGDLAVAARAEGPMVGPKEAWSVREGRVKTRGAKVRTFAIDEADVTLGAGSLAQVPFQAAVRGGEDRVKAEGVFRWPGKDPDVEATVDVSAADAAPYLKLLPEPPALVCRELRAAGRFRLRDGAPSFDGDVSAGAGEFQKIKWTGLAFKGTLDPKAVEAREIVVSGTPYAPRIVASGKLEGETLSLKFASDKDQGEIGGRYRANGDFDGRLRLEGPMAWLDPAFGITLPEKIMPIRAEGKVVHEKDDAVVMLEVTGKSDFAMSLSAKVRRKGDDWLIAVSPATITLPERKISYEAFVFALSPGRASLENLKIACTEPALAARVSGTAEWDRRQTRLAFRMLDTTVQGTPIDPLIARVTIERADGEKAVNLRWGRENGDHLLVTGKLGKELDLQAVLRAGDLKRPLVRHFLPGVELTGSIALDARVSGTAEEPQVVGTLNLSKVSTAGLPPLSLVIPIRSTKDSIRIWSVAEKTPYGAVTVEGTIPTRSLDAPIDLSLRVLTDDLSPLLDRMTPQARRWIPRGGLAAEAWLRGTPKAPELGGRAEFVALRWRPPPPLGEATDLRIVAQLDARGISFEMVDGLLGQGPFWAQGRFEAFSPGTPLTLWITAWDALAVEDPLARIRVKPDVMLTWTAGNPVRLSGRVEIPLAIYHREFTTAAPGSRPARQVSPPRLRLIPGETGGFLIPGIEGLEGVELDLAFKTTGECRIENSVIGVMFHAEGHLSGSPTEPALSGVFRSRENRGEVKLAPGHFLRMESLEIVLPEEVGRSPSVRFQGRVGAGEGAIQVFVDGPLDNPSLVLKSDPPMPQKDLLARLAFGHGSGALSREAGVAAVAIYLYEQAKEDWPSADRKEGFFDRFRPTVVPGDTSLQRRVPWELPPAGTLRSTSLRTEYVYNSYFSIVGETNREGDVAGDLKLRIRF